MLEVGGDGLTESSRSGTFRVDCLTWRDLIERPSQIAGQQAVPECLAQRPIGYLARHER